MEIVIKRADLVRELGVARRLADVKNVIPVYKFARLEPDSDGIEIFATNGESALRTHCRAEVRVPGVVLVPTGTLHDLAKAASKEDVTLTVDKNRVRVTCGGFASTLATLDVNDFPDFPIVTGEPVQLPAKAIRAAIARVKFVVEAANSKGGRDWAKGALLELSKGSALLIATDGHRIAQVSIAADLVTTERRAIIGGRSLSELEALLDSDDDTLTLALDDRRASFTVAGRTYITQLMEAQFPAYQRITAQLKTTNRAEIDRDAWRDLIARVRLVSSELALRVVFTFADDTLTARMASVEIGEATEQMPVTMSKGSGWETGFDARFVAEFLQAAGPGPVSIEQGKSEVDIAAFKSGNDYQYVLCPMRAV